MIEPPCWQVWGDPVRPGGAVVCSRQLCGDGEELGAHLHGAHLVDRAR